MAGGCRECQGHRMKVTPDITQTDIIVNMEHVFTASEPQVFNTTDDGESFHIDSTFSHKGVCFFYY